MDPQKVGNAIAYLRKMAGFTQKDLADRIGISDKAVSKWERGLSLPDISYLRKLSILLNTDSDSLLEGDVIHHASGWRGILVLDDMDRGINSATVIYDKPLVYFLLSYYALVGIREILIVCPQEETDRIRGIVEDGSDYGLSLSFYVGSIKDAATHWVCDSGNIMMIHGRCLLYGVDQTRFFQKAMMDRSHLCVLASPRREGRMNHKIAVYEDHRAYGEKIGKLLKIQYDYSSIPVSFFPASLFKELASAPAINEYFEKKAEEGDLHVEMLDRGFVEMELDDWDEVQEASAFMRIVQKNCGMVVYCLEEVVWRRGMISAGQLRALGEKHGDTPYGQYIISLCNRIEDNSPSGM